MTLQPPVASAVSVCKPAASVRDTARDSESGSVPAIISQAATQGQSTKQMFIFAVKLVSWSGRADSESDKLARALARSHARRPAACQSECQCHSPAVTGRSLAEGTTRPRFSAWGPSPEVEPEYSVRPGPGRSHTGRPWLGNMLSTIGPISSGI